MDEMDLVGSDVVRVRAVGGHTAVSWVDQMIEGR